MESKKKKKVLMNLVAGQNKDVDIENGLEDTEWGGGSWGEVRVASTYIHYQM